MANGGGFGWARWFQWGTGILVVLCVAGVGWTVENVIDLREFAATTKASRFTSVDAHNAHQSMLLAFNKTMLRMEEKLDRQNERMVEVREDVAAIKATVGREFVRP